MTLILIGGLRGVATRHVPSFQATAILASGSLGEGSPGMAALAAITTGFPALSFVLKERVFANAPALRVPALAHTPGMRTLRMLGRFSSRRRPRLASGAA